MTRDYQLAPLTLARLAATHTSTAHSLINESKVANTKGRGLAAIFQLK
jgi:hypothetical protein